MAVMNLLSGQEQRCRWRERTYERSRGRRGGADWVSSIHVWHVHMTTCKPDGRWEAAVQHRELSPGSATTQRDEGGVRGRLGREGVYVHLWLSHVAVWRRPAQHCKTIIPQVKLSEKKQVDGNVMTSMVARRGTNDRTLLTLVNKHRKGRKEGEGSETEPNCGWTHSNVYIMPVK